MLQLNKIRKEIHKHNTLASPILKWAGGKTQLLPVINDNLPQKIINRDIDTYIEPFLGGGAVFFNLYKRFNFKKIYLFDINPELIILYNSIKFHVDEVINELTVLSNKYLLDIPEDKRANFFYSVRDDYNNELSKIHKMLNKKVYSPRRAAMTIFLNRTCFNGLFRVNKKGYFNVPHGKYKNPTILFENKLYAVSEALQNAEIIQGDFTNCDTYLSDNTFIYYDPPYRPVSKSSSFNSYSKEDFNDIEQIRLANFYSHLNKKGVLQMLSNSDPSNYITDTFFDDLYSEFNILRVTATRRINSVSNKRGSLTEILVRNY